MLRNSFALLVMALGLAFLSVQAEEKTATATSTDSSETPAPVTTPAEGTPEPTTPVAEPSQPARRSSETAFKKLKQIDPNIKITKVHEFRNDEDYNSAGNPALEFERLYWNHGAILGDEVEARRGHYFVITWVNKGPASDFTTRFEYRQVNSKDVIRTLTLNHKNAKGASRSTFAVLGNAYRTYGPVNAWRFVVLKGDQVVGEEHSFIW